MIIQLQTIQGKITIHDFILDYYNLQQGNFW